MRRIASELIPLLKGVKSVIDIGCGNGDLAKFIEQEGIKYHGVDVVDSPLSSRKFKKSNIPYPFKDKSFDAALLIFTLHHMTDPEEGLKEAKRIAAKRILILEDVPRNEVERWCVKAIDFFGNKFVSSEIPLPYTFRDDSSWKRTFQRHGLRLKSVKTVHPLAFPRLNHQLYELVV